MDNAKQADAAMDGVIRDCGSENLALLLLFFNCVCAGLGTVVSACIGKECSCKILIVGILQMILGPCCCIGYCWSIYHGVKLYKKAAKI